MSKGRFYGVYGFEGGGIYSYKWPQMRENMIGIKGVKVKRHPKRDMAAKYIVDGLVHDYHVCEEKEIRTDVLCANTNRFLNLEELLTPSTDGTSRCPYYII